MPKTVLKTRLKQIRYGEDKMNKVETFTTKQQIVIDLIKDYRFKLADDYVCENIKSLAHQVRFWEILNYKFCNKYKYFETFGELIKDTEKLILNKLDNLLEAK